MKKMLWMAAVVALLLTPMLVNAADDGDDGKAKWMALSVEIRGLRMALYKAKIAAKKDNADIEALSKDMRAARTAVFEAEKADKTIAAAAKVVADIMAKQKEFKSNLEALKPIIAKKEALVYPGKDATKKARREYMKALQTLMSEERKILFASADYKALLAEAIKARKAHMGARANSEAVKAAKAKVAELAKKVNDLVMAVPAVKEIAEKLAIKQNELKGLKRPTSIRPQLLKEG